MHAARSYKDAKAYVANTVFARNRPISPTEESAVIGSEGSLTSLQHELVHVTAADNEVPSFLHCETNRDEGDWITVTVMKTLLMSFTNAFVVD